MVKSYKAKDMNSQKLILVKLGGSLITDKSKPETPRIEIIKKLAREIKEIQEEGKYGLIIGHGSGSFAHVPAKSYETKKGFVNEKSQYGMCLVQDSAAKLNRIIVQKFLEEQINVYSINPSSSILSAGGKIVDWYLNPLRKLLLYQVIPVVYGDVVLDENQGCAILSTEILLNYLARSLKNEYRIEKIIYLGITDGVWGENKKIIPKITTKDYCELQKCFGASGGIDVTGGMEHKMSEAMEIAKQGIEVVIGNGKTPGILSKILRGEKENCTKIIK